VPAPAAEDPDRALRRAPRIGFDRMSGIILIEPVPAPLPYVSVHVEQNPAIPVLAADPMGPETPVRVLPGDLGQARFLAEAERGGASCPAGVFPLRLGWQPVAGAVPGPTGAEAIERLQSVEHAQCITERDRVAPAHVDHGLLVRLSESGV